MFAVSRILILLLLFYTWNSSAQNVNPSSSCSSSSCGNITNISFPFRLKGDPISCGYPRYIFELDCQQNRAILSISSKKYYVQEINYSDFSIRLVDPGINIGNLSSCPIYSNAYYDWPDNIFDRFLAWNVPVAFVYCLTPVNSSQYVEAPYCGNRSSIFSNSSEIYSYAMVGEGIGLTDLEESCAAYKVQQVPRGVSGFASWGRIHDGMGYGFELSWFRVLCGECERTYGFCSLEGNKVTCKHHCRTDIQPEHLSLPCKFKYYGTIAGIFSGLGISGILGLRFAIGFIFLVGLVVYKWRQRHLALDETIEDFLQAQNNLTPIKYTYSEIKKMTNNFKERLGEGGYGTVYRGKLRSGPYVAVKLMVQSMASEENFMTEVGTIGRIHHVNVVQLIGYCVEGSKCCLVYEFLPNGSLDRCIFTQSFGDGNLYLRYEKMFEIALGVARGIDYLHRGCDMQILHFDIKPHNILLDEKFSPKISDFGLAKLYPTNGSAINLTAARGTMGYMAPEMFYKNIGGVSYKADVYSFGMLLLEMAGRRKNMNPFAEDVSQIYFPSWAYDQVSSGNEIDIKDATDEERQMVRKIVIVALWCIQMKPSERPSMNKVVEMLEGDTELRIPPKPFLAPREIAKGDGMIDHF